MIHIVASSAPAWCIHWRYIHDS